MREKILGGVLCLLVAVSILRPAAAAYLGSTDPDFPNRSFELYLKQMEELKAFAGIDCGLEILKNLACDVHEYARERWELDGLTVFQQEVTNAVIVYYAEPACEAALVCAGSAAELLTDSEIAAIEWAFAAPESDDPYVHVVNGMKQLLVCVFQSGRFEVPTYSYTAAYLRAPDVVLDATRAPDTRILVSGNDAAKEAQCDYLGDEIGRYAGISVDVSILPGDPKDTLEEGAEQLRTMPSDDDPDTTVVYLYDTDTGDAVFTAGELAEPLFPANTAKRLTAALEASDGDAYDRAIAVLEEMVWILCADGARDDDAASVIPIVLGSTSAVETGGGAPVLWIGLGGFLTLAVLAGVIVRAKKQNVM